MNRLRAERRIGKPMLVPIIETERLRLRGWVQEDQGSLAELNSDERFTQYIGNGKPLDRSESWRAMAAFVGHWHLKGFGLWLVEIKDTAEFIGRIGLYEPEGWPGIEVGWGISPKHWGKGYATEGARAAMQWAFDTLNLESLISVIHPENIASINVALRLGEKFIRMEKIKNTECSIYSISKDEYVQKCI